MEYDFCDQCPIVGEMADLKNADPEAYGVLLYKLERYRPYPFVALLKDRKIEKIKVKGRNPLKMHEFRIALPDIICRLYCLPRQERLEIYRLVVKKSKKLKPKDLEVAMARAKKHQQTHH